MVGLKGKDKEVLSGLKTESRNPRTLDLDLMSVGELLTVMNEEDKNVIEAVKQALPQIQETVEAVICALNKGGRLIYAGAGTSGRLGILDAVECLPTFSTTDEVVGIMAGGEKAFVHAQEGVEDSKEEGRKDLEHLKVDERDVVVALSASGSTPYCIGALECAREAGACCVGLSCNRPAELTEVPNLTFIESKWNLGDFLIFDTANARRILRIGYLDAMKKYGIYDGSYYTFTKDAFDKSTLAAADTAAKIFSLDPLILYRPQTFRHYLAEAVSGAIDAVSEEFEIADLANPAKLKLLFKTVSKPNLILLLAKLLREKGPDILNALKILPRMLDDEIAAAKLLARWELV